MKKTILIIGATSPIARAAAACWAARGYGLYLTSRDKGELERVAADLSIRYGITVRHVVFDIEAIEQHEAFASRIFAEPEGVYGVLFACGYLGDQALAVSCFAEARKIIDVNYTGACSILTYCANALAQQRSGFIAALSSVAGDRGRQSNYLYGSAKGGLSLFLEGLRNRLYPLGVHVLTVKPGFVDTSMTYGRPGMFMVATPDHVGSAIVKAVDKKRNVIYVPWFWRLIMSVIRAVPECIFKRLKL